MEGRGRNDSSISRLHKTVARTIALPLIEQSWVVIQSLHLTGEGEGAGSSIGRRWQGESGGRVIGWNNLHCHPMNYAAGKLSNLMKFIYLLTYLPLASTARHKKTTWLKKPSRFYSWQNFNCKWMSSPEYNRFLICLVSCLFWHICTSTHSHTKWGKYSMSRY